MNLCFTGRSEPPSPRRRSTRLHTKEEMLVASQVEITTAVNQVSPCKKTESKSPATPNRRARSIIETGDASPSPRMQTRGRLHKTVDLVEELPLRPRTPARRSKLKELSPVKAVSRTNKEDVSLSESAVGTVTTEPPVPQESPTHLAAVSAMSSASGVATSADAANTPGTPSRKTLEQKSDEKDDGSGAPLTPNRRSLRLHSKEESTAVACETKMDEVLVAEQKTPTRRRRSGNLVETDYVPVNLLQDDSRSTIKTPVRRSRRSEVLVSETVASGDERYKLELQLTPRRSSRLAGKIEGETIVSAHSPVKTTEQSVEKKDSNSNILSPRIVSGSFLFLNEFCISNIDLHFTALFC
jgi:hypothetical protein